MDLPLVSAFIVSFLRLIWRQISFLVVALALADALAPSTLVAREFYVSLSGDDAGPGSLNEPFKSLEQASKLMKGGDTCFIRGGSYPESLRVDRKGGTEGGPIVFRNYPGERVVFDGTESIDDLKDGEWVELGDGVFGIPLSQDIWQLFVDGELMVPARWPNAQFANGSIWRIDSWAQGNEAASENGILVDDPASGYDLAASGLDVSGAMAILNVGSWKTWTREVLQHRSGSGTFRYEEAATYLPKDHHYFLEGKLDFLDTDKEWYFDAVTKTLYLRLPGGEKPKGDIRGKVRDYAFEFVESPHVHLLGLEFFGTTFRFEDSPYARVVDCNLRFPSCSKRMLKQAGPPVATTLQHREFSSPSYSRVENCTFSYAGSHALYLNGKGDIIENCLFEYTDWSPSELPFLMGSVLLLGDGSVFRRNTSHTSGASEFLDVGKRALVELNDVSSYGLLQGDGAMAQVTIPAQPGCIIRYNWFHDSPQLGARFDAPIPPTRWGRGGQMHSNVGWNLRSMIMIKGESHDVSYNTSIGGTNNGMIILDDSKVGGGANAGTSVLGNAADTLSGHRKAFRKVPGTVRANWNGYQVGESLASELVEPSAFDFRPREGSSLASMGAGAYRYGDSRYWIPGRLLEKASRPIPADGAVISSEGRDLIWLPAKGAATCDVYLGTEPSDLRLIASHRKAEENVFFLRNIEPLEKERTYYWRVDALSSVGELVIGDLWSFSVGSVVK